MQPKSKNRRILLTCAGGPAAQYFAEKLSSDHVVFLADAAEHTFAPYLGMSFQKIPFGDSPEFMPAMQELVGRERIEIIVPGADQELLPLAALCREQDVTMVAPNAEFIELCLNKRKLTAALHEQSLSALTVYESEREAVFPLVIKPNSASGSRGVHIVYSAEQLRAYFDLYQVDISAVVMQPYIEGDEYTVSVIVNDVNVVIGVVPKRVLMKRGITKAAVTERHELIECVCQGIVDAYRPQGPFNVQLKIQGNAAYIFEINPRLSTTSVLTDAAFGNEITLFLDNSQKLHIPTPPTLRPGVHMYRYEQQYFV